MNWIDLVKDHNEEQVGTIITFKTKAELLREIGKARHVLSLRTLGYALGLLWFVSGLLMLQTSLIASDDLQNPSVQTTAAMQDRQIAQPSEPNGRQQNSNLSAPVRAILSPTYYSANKALPLGGNGLFLIASGWISLAIFILAALQNFKRNQTFLRRHIAIRARAPPAFRFA